MMSMTTDPLDDLTLQNFARLLLGMDHTQIHNDLARLGYTVMVGNKKRISHFGAGLFRYQDYENYDPTIRATEAGRERIVQHYINDELTMKPPYTKYTWSGVDYFSFNEGSVAAYAEKVRPALTSDQRKTIDDVIALNGRKIGGDYDLYKRVEALGMYLRSIDVIP
jgi:hypothetical protein